MADAERNHWQLTVIDGNLALARSKINNHPNGTARSFDISDLPQRNEAIASATVVISMLPAQLHFEVAKACLHFGKHLLTASYVDEKLRSLEKQVQEKGLLFLCEMGLDPGIDHMSAMQLIHKIQREGGIIRSFMSHCGGLIAPESDTNPWHYKITWNPANVVNAGKAGAQFRKNGKTIEIPYRGIFDNPEKIEVANVGTYVYYPNRDALTYSKLYGLEAADSFIRSTLRHADFCKGWHFLVLAGFTSDRPLEVTPGQELKDWADQTFLNYTGSANLDTFIERMVPRAEQQLVARLFKYLGLNAASPLPVLERYTNSALLQYLLETQLPLASTDRDMVLMVHEIDFMRDGQSCSRKSELVVKGDPDGHTAMAKTVGLPLAIATGLLMGQKISVRGVHIPIIPDIYEPVLQRLSKNGIYFNET